MTSQRSSKCRRQRLGGHSGWELETGLDPDAASSLSLPLSLSLLLLLVLSVSPFLALARLQISAGGDHGPLRLDKQGGVAKDLGGTVPLAWLGLACQGERPGVRAALAEKVKLSAHRSSEALQKSFHGLHGLVLRLQPAHGRLLVKNDNHCSEKACQIVLSVTAQATT
eukprot:scaffold69_cov248-Pinguiococcus_pyrenoidosus.AAC.19